MSRAMRARPASITSSSPCFQAYVRGSGNWQDYDHAAGFTAAVPGVFIPKRDSTDYRADVGARIDLTGVTYAEIYGGYLAQHYSSSFFGSIEGFDAGAALTWNATTLDTVKLSATRTVQNANAEIVGPAAASAGYLASVMSASIDHELLRNLLLNANAGYEIDDWHGINRTDDIPSVGAGAKYLMMRNLYLGASWTYQRRYSSGINEGLPYTQNIFLLRLSTQL